MPQLRILFDLSQLRDAVPARAAFRGLFAALDRRMLTGCSLYHGFGEPGGRYSIAIDCPDVMLLDAMRRSAEMSSRWGTVAPTVVFDDSPLRSDRMVLAARVDSVGNLTDVRPEWLPQLWHESQEPVVAPPPSPPPQPSMPSFAGEPVSTVPPPQPPPPPAPVRSPEGPPNVYPAAWPGPRPQTPYAAGPPVESAPAPFAPPSAAPAGAVPVSLRSHPQFPLSLPEPLRLAATRSRSRPAIIGVAAGASLSLLFFWISPRGSMLAEMFDPRRPSTIIPMAILAMFFWGAIICVTRWKCLRAMETISGKPLLLAAVPLLEHPGIHALENDLSGPAVEASPLLRRMKAVLHQWGLRPGLQDADVVLQQLSASDDEVVHAGYSLVRTFVWALPVLGLIGTVIGIAVAVGGFSTFLGGNIDDVGIIKQNLVNVTGGLSFAFLITLEGLLTSLLIMLAASSLQTRERALYARIQQEIADVLVPGLQRVAPDSVKTQTTRRPESAPMTDMLVQHVQLVTGQMEALGDRVLKAVEEKHELWIRQLASTGTDVVGVIEKAGEKGWESARERTEALVRAISDGMSAASHQAGADMAKAGSDFLAGLNAARHELAALMAEEANAAARRQSDFVAGLAGVRQEFGALMAEEAKSAATRQADLIAGLAGVRQEFATLMTEQTTAATARQQEIERQSAASTARQHEFLERLNDQAAQSAARQQALADQLVAQAEATRSAASSLSGLTETARLAIASQQGLQEALRAMDGGRVEAAVQGFSTALGASSSEMRNVLQAAEALGQLTQQVISSQAELQMATRQLADTRFLGMLTEFRDALTRLGPVLANFQKPFVLQAVPVSSGQGD